MKAINFKNEAKKIKNLYEYHRIAEMNNYMFNLVKAKMRTLEWHRHEATDEVFIVLEGKMNIELREGMVELNEGEMFVVKRGIEHRPVCKEDVTGLLIEPIGTLNANNTGGSYKG